MSVFHQNILAGASGAGGAGDPVYVDDVYSTFLYDGTGSSLSINNGIDLSGEGGAVWIKARSNETYKNHTIVDSERGKDSSNSFKVLFPNLADSEYSPGSAANATVSSFNSNGFTAGNNLNTNVSGGDYVSWTFRKAPGFFDIVTWTGSGSVRTISHNLGSTPGFIAIKRTSASEDWTCYHRSIGATHFIQLNGSSPKVDLEQFMNDTEPTSTHFTVGTHDRVNTNGQTYVAYVFAHDDQSFGTNSDEAIIKCGSYSGSIGNGGFVDLGFEPQWVLFRRTDSSEDWEMSDTMRGAPIDGDCKRLLANTNGAESTISSPRFEPRPTGFNQNITGSNAATVIYIAIRRPHKPPAAGTEVFTADAAGLNAQAGQKTFDSNHYVDLVIHKHRTSSSVGAQWFDRIRGGGKRLDSYNNNAEVSQTSVQFFDIQDGVKADQSGGNFGNYLGLMFKRAGGFMDIVSYSGNSVAGTSHNHNLGAVPEFIICKATNQQAGFWCYHKDLSTNYAIRLDGSSNGSVAQESSSNYWNSSTHSATTFTLGNYGDINGSNKFFISYLFATLSGVSKVGSYSGTGSDINVNCGFSAGARFVLIKRIDSTGNWHLWDTSRGIVSGNDFLFYLNKADAEIDYYDYIDPLNAGFTVTSSAPAALNASGGTYLFLAIA